MFSLMKCPVRIGNVALISLTTCIETEAILCTSTSAINAGIPAPDSASSFKRRLSATSRTDAF